MSLIENDGSPPPRPADRQMLPPLLQLAPRRTRYEPDEGPVGSVTLPPV